jgi:hypothetical protein
MQQPQKNDVSMLIYRIDTLEKEVERLSMQLSNYVPQRENDLKLQSIQEIVRRIEAEIIAAKQQLATMNTKLADQEIAARERDEKERQQRDKIQIDTLKWILITITGLVVMVIGGVVVYFLTHPGG